MEIDKINSLVELFFEKYKEKKLTTKQPFLKWLKNNENSFFIYSSISYYNKLLYIMILMHKLEAKKFI